MNFIQLVIRFHEEAGIAGAGPTSTVNQLGQHKKSINWVQQAWVDIQNKRPNWEFMREEFTFDTIAGQRDYKADDVSITDLRLWDLESFLLYDKSIGETDQKKIINISYSYWRNVYRAQMNIRPLDRTQYLTVLPTNVIRFEPNPDIVYTIDGEYKRSSQFFIADADVPTNLPDAFHMVIVWQALKNYASSENAAEVMDQAETNFDILMNRLEIEQLPQMAEDRPPLA